MRRFLLPLVLTLIVVGLGVEAILIAAINDKLNRVDRDQQNVATISIAALNAAEFSQPAISVTNKRVYFPELQIYLPLDTISTSLLYNGRQAGNPDKDVNTNYDITTRSLASLSPIGYQTQKACYPVRVTFEPSANKYTSYEDTSTVKLSGDRTMQVYANNDPACRSQYATAGIVPDAIKKAFEGAVAYE